jgi:hypothetical protein
MPSFIVIKFDVVFDSLVKLYAAVWRVEVNVLVFEASPEPFDEDVVQGPSLSIHRDFNVVFFS